MARTAASKLPEVQYHGYSTATVVHEYMIDAILNAATLLDVTTRRIDPKRLRSLALWGMAGSVEYPSDLYRPKGRSLIGVAGRDGLPAKRYISPWVYCLDYVAEVAGDPVATAWCSLDLAANSRFAEAVQRSATVLAHTTIRDVKHTPEQFVAKLATGFDLQMPMSPRLCEAILSAAGVCYPTSQITSAA